MNDQGLFFDILLTEPLEIKLSKEKPIFKGNFFDKFMAECATVKEVLDLFDNYNLEFMLKFQFFVVDRTGDSVIIEGDHTIRKTGSYQVVTNSKIVCRRSRPILWLDFRFRLLKTFFAHLQNPYLFILQIYPKAL